MKKLLLVFFMILLSSSIFAGELSISNFHKNSSLPSAISDELRHQYGIEVNENNIEVRNNYNLAKSIGVAGISRFFALHDKIGTIDDKSVATNFYTTTFSEDRNGTTVSYKCDLTVSLDKKGQSYFIQIDSCHLTNFNPMFFMNP